MARFAIALIAPWSVSLLVELLSPWSISFLTERFFTLMMLKNAA